MSLSIQTKTSDAKFTVAEINFPNGNFIVGSDLSENKKELLEGGILSRIPVQIRLAKMNDFTFMKNGFEYTDLNGPVLDDVRRFSADPGSERFRLRFIKSATTFANEWLKAQGLKFTAVPLVLSYRNENEQIDGSLRPIPLVHVDFDPFHLQKTLRAVRRTFQPCTEIILGKISKENYQELCSRIETILTFWVPLNKSRTQNTLCLMDTSSFDPSDLELCSIVTDAMTLPFSPNQKWATCDGMARGKGLFFDSMRTPHSAATLQEQEGPFHEKYRRSGEIKFGLITL